MNSKRFNRKSTYLSALVTSVAITLSPLQSVAETINGALATAYNHSNLLEQTRALLRASDEDVATALSALRPQINGSASITQSDQATGPGGGNLNSTIAIGLDLLLWDAGSTRLAVEAAKETVLAGRANLVNQEQSVLLNAARAYLALSRDIRIVAVREGNLRLITQELRAARDRFEVGEVTRTDVAQAEARLAEARGILAQAQGNREISRANYLAAIGHQPRNLQSVRRFPKLPNSVEAARDIAARIHPSINAVQHQISANELNLARTEANIRPRIDLSASVGHSRFSDNNSSVGLTMRVPIYQGGQLSALKRRALAVVHASRAELKQTVLTVRQDVTEAWAQLAVANAQVSASEQQIRAAQIAFDGAREEAKLGARTTLDVLDAEQDLSDARTNRVVAETDAYIAAYGVVAAMGRLTASDLGLSVQEYDPSEYFNAVKSAPIRKSKEGAKLDRILKRYGKK